MHPHVVKRTHLIFKKILLNSPFKKDYATLGFWKRLVSKWACLILYLQPYARPTTLYGREVNVKLLDGCIWSQDDMAARPSLCQTCVGGVSSSGGGDRWVGGGIKEVSSVRIFFIKCLEHFEALTQVLQLEIRGTCAIYKNLAQSAFRLIRQSKQARVFKNGRESHPAY